MAGTFELATPPVNPARVRGQIRCSVNLPALIESSSKPLRRDRYV
jgi:hypothetical protein